jgi:lysozyme family protein
MAPEMQLFDTCFALLIGHEGAFQDDPKDPGNWTGGDCGLGECRGTKWGISARTYPDLDIAGLSLDAARGLYARDFWRASGADRLPPPLALLAFDVAVHSGADRAVRLLQRSVKAKEDGVLGPQTMGAVDRALIHGGGLDALCAEFLAQRTVFASDLRNWRHNRLGWMRRLFGLAYQSTEIG